MRIILSAYLLVLSGCATKPQINCSGEAGDSNTDISCRLVTPE